MSKKAKAAPAEDIDSMIDGDATPAAPAAKKAKAGALSPVSPTKPKKGGGTRAAAEPAPAAKKTKGKAAPAPEPKKAAAPGADSALRKALLKVKKSVSYADFAEANDFNIRTVRRAARAMRDAGEIDLTREGQTVYISAAV